MKNKFLQRFKNSALLYEKIFLNPSRLKVFDGLRAVSILSVVIFHVVQEAIHRKYLPVKYLAAVSEVVAFFFLSFFFGSGFVIGLVLLRQYEKTRKINFFGFWARRIIRTWPLYFAMLIVSLFLFDTPDRLPIYRYITFTQNFSLSRFFPFSWSIAIEEQFYFFAPVFMLFFIRFGIIRVCLPIVLLTLLARHYFAVVMFENNNHTLAWFDGFTIGASMACVYFKQNNFHHFIMKNANVLSLTGILLFFIFFNYRKEYATCFPLLSFISIAAAFYPLISTRHFFSKFLSEKYLSFIAATSYTLYLIHGSIIDTLYTHFSSFVFQYNYGLAIMLAGSILLSLVLSTAIFFLIEIPIYRWRLKIFKY